MTSDGLCRPAPSFCAIPETTGARHEEKTQQVGSGPDGLGVGGSCRCSEGSVGAVVQDPVVLLSSARYGGFCGRCGLAIRVGQDRSVPIRIRRCGSRRVPSAGSDDQDDHRRLTAVPGRVGGIPAATAVVRNVTGGLAK